MSNWNSVDVKLPEQNQRVLAKYEGVYGPRVVTFWFDGTNTHFGDPPMSQPATHWHLLPDDEKQPKVGQAVSIETLEAAHIASVVDQVETLDQAARILGIDIATLYRKRRKLKLPMRFTTGEKR